MGNVFTIAISILTVLAIWKTAVEWRARRAFKRFAEEHGCEEPPRNWMTYYTWGLDSLLAVCIAVIKGLDLSEDLIKPRHGAVAGEAHTLVATTPFGSDIIDTDAPENSYAILSRQTTDFVKSELVCQQLEPVLGHSILNANGEAWRIGRRGLAPFVSPRRNEDNLKAADVAAIKFLDSLTAHLPKEKRETGPINLTDAIYRYSFANPMHLVFGSSAEMNGQEDQIEAAFSKAMEWLGWRIKLCDLFWLANTKAWRRSCSLLRRLCDENIDRAVRLEKAEDGFKTMTEVLQSFGGRAQAADHILALMSAGRDTVASLMQWLFCELARHPATFRRLRHEILAKYGDNPDEPLSLEELESCAYLDAAINETLRMYPPLPLNAWTAARDCVLPMGGGRDGKSPVAMRKGQRVNVFYYLIQRRQDLWGEDADEFRPGRWKNLELKPGMFVPFSGGRRGCIGEQFAMMEARVLIIRMLQSFDRLDWEGEERITKAFGVTMRPANGVPVCLHRAELRRDSMTTD